MAAYRVNRHAKRRAACVAAVLLACGPAAAGPLVAGLKIGQVDRAFRSAATDAGVAAVIGKAECGPGMPGFFCSYPAGRGLRLIAGAPTLSSDIDSLDVESTGGKVSGPLRGLLALTVAVLEPQSSPQGRADLLERLIAAAEAGKEAVVRGERAEFTFNRFGYGLVFAARPVGG